MEKNIQFYADVNEHGEIINAQMGINIVQTQPFPIFIMIDEEQAARVSANMVNFRIEIKNFRPQLVEKGASAE